MSKLIKDIQEFFRLNTESNRIKKLKDPMNESIKSGIKEEYAVGDGESVTVVAGDVQAIYQSIAKEDINQQMLMEILKEKGFKQAIKTIEVVDPDVVEQLIYDGELSPVDLEPCKDTSYTVKLTVKLTPEAAKKEKEAKKNANKGTVEELRNQLRGQEESMAQDRF